MSDPTIEFQEIEVTTSQLLQEIGAPGLKKNFRLPPGIALELRRQQIARLEENIALLRRKQDEFHRKMEDYITSLHGLIENLRGGLDAGASEAAGSGEAAAPAEAPAEAARQEGGTHVRCVGCGSERLFPDLDILFAREPDDLFARPTEVIIQQDGKLKKGVFRCPRCGDCNLSIRPR